MPSAGGSSIPWFVLSAIPVVTAVNALLWFDSDACLGVSPSGSGNVLVVDPELLKKAQRGRIQLDDYTASNGSVDNQFVCSMLSHTIFSLCCVFLVLSTPCSLVSLALPQRIPMFSVDLMEREGELTYSTTPERFRAVLLGVFERALDACRNIPAVEPFVMDQVALFPPLVWYGDEDGLCMKGWVDLTVPLFHCAFFYCFLCTSSAGMRSQC